MNAPLIRNPFGLAVIALTCGAFWLGLGLAAAHADPLEHQLDAINMRTQRDVIYAASPAWVDGPRGNCTVFAIHNAHVLEAAHLPAHVWYVLTEGGAKHMVTVSGDWVLDERFTHIERRVVLEHYGYTFVMDFGPL